ncbi:MAG: dihydrofolate reductase [Clostridia bacterium]|nr:dihydrofolate reductase [Clostridia bacterium]
MKAIVAVDKNWGIGKKNDLLFSLPEDMKYFREKTLNKVVVMGSNTLKSFPGGKPLKNRTNIVLFPGGEKRDDCVIVESLEELSAVLKGYDTEDVFIIGGAMFYKTMLPYCSEVLVTKVDADGGAEVFYENLDKLENWSCISVGDKIETNGYDIRFTVYKNSNVKQF